VSDAAPAPETAVEPRRGGAAVFRVLRHRDFALFWSGQAVSLIGTWMQGFAQGWVVTTLTADAFALGLLNFATALPALILMPFGGVVADRLERRRILMWTQWVFLALAAAAGGLVAAGRLELWHIYAMALPLGIATAYELPAYQAYYPQLVDKEDLSHAISLNQATFHGSRIVGPALAGGLVAAWGTAAAFFANAVSFLPLIGALALIPARPAPPRDGGSTRNFMAEGFRYVRDRPRVLSLLGLTAATTFFIFPNLAILTPFYIKHVLGEQAAALGLLMSFSGGGALVGSAAMLSVRPEQRVTRIVACVSLMLVTMTGMAWAGNLWVAIAAATLQSVALSHSLGLASLMIQECVPDRLRGRVMSLYSLTFMGIMPFAALIVTRLADAIGMRIELQIAGVLYAAAGITLMAWHCRSPQPTDCGDDPAAASGDSPSPSVAADAASESASHPASDSAADSAKEAGPRPQEPRD
jgi:MFS family permease